MRGDKSISSAEIAMKKIGCRMEKNAAGSVCDTLRGTWILLTVLLVYGATAQNLETIGQGEALTVSGGINLNQVFYQASGVEDRRDPYNYFLSGNLNFNVYGWAVPLSFSYSNQNTSFQQPFNQYGLSPTYKWVTAHLGYRSMTFSKYTLSGHLFLGAGVDLAPSDKVKVSAMYGRLQKAVARDTAQSNNIPTYKRMGGGAKVTIGGGDRYVDLIFFRAADDVNSLAPDTTDMIFPEENFVVGLGLNTTLFKGLAFKGEVAYSAITNDMRAEKVETSNVYDQLPFLYQPRASSEYYKAISSALQYQFKKYTFGVAYERVDPGYRTLGAYYFNNDLENIALTHTSRWFNQKLSVNARGGVQRNNLDKEELNTMSRFSGALSVNYQVSPKLVTTFNYSNFSTVVNFRTPQDLLNQVTRYDNLDTLNYHQISQNSSLGVNYVLGQSKERRQNLNANFSYQQTDEEQGGESQASGTKFYNFNAAYSLGLQPQGLTLSVAGNTNVSQSQSGESLIFGPSVSIRKKLLENKLSTTGSISFNNSKVNGTLSSRVINLRLGANYSLLEKHQFTLNITAVDRFSPQNESVSRYREFVAELGYNYNFSTR